MIPPRLHDILRCPETGERLEESEAQLRSSAATFPIICGIPILLRHDGIPCPEEIEPPGPSGDAPRWRALAQRLVPEPSPAGDTAARYRKFGDALPGRQVLVIGGAIAGQGIGELTDKANLIETDIYIGPQTAIVCDGHHLPFADGSFDGVVIQAVLEHVLDPQQVVAEIHRVLRQGGVVFAETPFMQQVHEGSHDFTRWTETGHRRLFRMFATIETGITAGPAVTLLWSLAYFARSFGRTRTTQLTLEKLALILFAWLKRLDRRMVDWPTATDGASGVYFIGVRAEQPVDDREVLAAYRGAITVESRRERRDV